MKGSARYQEAWVNPTQRNPSKDEGISDQGTDPITIAIWGDPVVAQALALLLRSSGYDTRILSDSSLDNPKVVKGVNLLLLTPTLNLRSKQRKAFLASLSNVREITKIPVLELVAFPGETREEETRDELWYRLPWPCRTEKLEQWIEATLAPLPRT
jgi:hypothetical protein